MVEAPKPFDEKQGWIKNEEGLLEPIWSTGSIISNDLVDVVAHKSDTKEELDEIEDLRKVLEYTTKMRAFRRCRFYYTKKIKNC